MITYHTERRDNKVTKGDRVDLLQIKNTQTSSLHTVYAMRIVGLLLWNSTVTHIVKHLKPYTEF